MEQSKTLHIFFVLSNITQLVVESYITEQNLQEVIILHPKRFTPSLTGYKLVYFPYFDDKVTYGLVGKNFIKKKKHCKEIHHYLSELTQGNAFEFYAPHFYINSLRIIIESPLCKNFSYIEEGTLSFYTTQNIEKVMPDVEFNYLEKLGFGFGKRMAFPDISKKGIGVNPEVFPSLPNRHIVHSDTIRSILSNWAKTHSTNFTNQAILIFDPSVENKMTKLENYILALIDSIRFIKEKGHQKIYYKFHPDQKLYPLIGYFRKYLDNKAFGVEFEELEENVSLELVFMNTSNLLVVHTMSSLGFYAKLQHHQVYSNATSLLEDRSFKKNYFDKVNDLFQFALIPKNA